MAKRNGLNNPRILKTDPVAHNRIMRLVKLTELEQGVPKLSSQEITRRMVRAKSFDSLEREILDDAKMKKLIKEGRV